MFSKNNATDSRSEHIEFLSAAAAVYAWVSAADGVISKLEIDVFINYLTSLDYVDEISDEDFQEIYLSLLEAYRNNFEDGKNRSIVRIESFSGDSEKAKDLVRIAKMVLQADDRLDEAEQAAIAEICSLLGISES